MSEPNRVIDESLQAFERALTSTPLSVSEEQRHNILYACGVAQGRLQGKCEMRRWHIAAAALWLISLGSVVVLSRHRPGDPPVPSIATAHPVTSGKVSTGSPEPHLTRQTLAPKAETGLPPPDDSPRDLGRLTAGLRLDLALALIDGPVNFAKSITVPRQENDPTPLRPTSRTIP